MHNDLISRSALRAILTEERNRWKYESSYQIGICYGLAVAKSALENAPTVDAVEVVRCGDCIHRTYLEIEDCTIGGCELIGFPTPCDFYCAEGKRRIDDGK